MQAGKNGAIKIGITRRHPMERAKIVQSHTPYDLSLLGFFLGTFSDERKIHKQFTTAKIRGEWFKAVDELTRFIDKKCGKFDANALIDSAFNEKLRRAYFRVKPHYTHENWPIFTEIMKTNNVSVFDLVKWGDRQKLIDSDSIRGIKVGLRQYRVYLSKLQRPPKSKKRRRSESSP